MRACTSDVLVCCALDLVRSLSQVVETVKSAMFLRGTSTDAVINQCLLDLVRSRVCACDTPRVTPLNNRRL